MEERTYPLLYRQGGRHSPLRLEVRAHRDRSHLLVDLVHKEGFSLARVFVRDEHASAWWLQEAPRLVAMVKDAAEAQARVRRAEIRDRAGGWDRRPRVAKAA